MRFSWSLFHQFLNSTVQTRHLNRMAMWARLRACRARKNGSSHSQHLHVPDHSELSSACESPVAVVSQIDKYGLSDITDYIDPSGPITARLWEKDAPWRRKK